MKTYIGKDKADMIGVALEIGTNMIFADWIFGLGGAVAGWKANGLLRPTGSGWKTAGPGNAPPIPTRRRTST